MYGIHQKATHFVSGHVSEDILDWEELAVSNEAYAECSSLLLFPYCDLL